MRDRLGVPSSPLRINAFPKTRPRPNSSAVLGVASIIVAAGAACFFVPFNCFDTSHADTPSLWFAVAGSLLVGVGSILLVRWRCWSLGAPTLARLGPAYVLYFTFAFGASALAWLNPQAGSRAVIQPAQIPSAVATASLGLIAWTVGYMLGPPKAVSRGAKAIRQFLAPSTDWCMRSTSLPIVLYFIAIMVRLVRLSSGSFGYFQDASDTLASPSSFDQVLGAIQSLSLYALVLAAIDALILSRDLRSRIVLVLLAGSELAFGFFAASKETVLLTVLALVLATMFIRRRLPVIAVVIGLAVVLLLFPFNREYRQTIRGGSGAVSPTAALGVLPQTLAGVLMDTSPRSVIVDTPALIAARVRQIDNVAIVRQRTPKEFGWRPWTELGVGPATGWVPRAIWANKPLLSTAREFSLDYYKIPSKVYTGTAVTVPGDLYRHGGIIPLLCGMLMLGVTARIVDVNLDPGRDPRLLLPFIAMFILLIKSESDVTVLLIGLVQVAVVSALLCRTAFVTRRCK